MLDKTGKICYNHKVLDIKVHDKPDFEVIIMQETAETEQSREQNGDIDEKLTGLIHSWFARLRGNISAGKSEFIGGQVQLERNRILLTIRHNGELAQKQLAVKLNVSPQSMSESLTKLEHDGYITRRKSCLDKRETIVALTQAGSVRAEELAQKMREHSHLFLQPLTVQEKQTLYNLLKKLAADHTDS